MYKQNTKTRQITLGRQRRVSIPVSIINYIISDGERVACECDGVGGGGGGWQREVHRLTKYNINLGFIKPLSVMDVHFCHCNLIRMPLTEFLEIPLPEFNSSFIVRNAIICAYSITSNIFQASTCRYSIYTP